jgi:hypothetical protein
MKVTYSVTEDANYLLSEASSSILKYYGKKLSFLELDALLTVATDTIVSVVPKVKRTLSMSSNFVTLLRMSKSLTKKFFPKKKMLLKELEVCM